MPLGFTGGRLAPQIERFGNDAAQMILQTGATIEQGLQRMMTNRQVAGLGQELGTLNPESPEWAQQAVQLGSRYPLAMKSPAGQFMLGTQAKAHAQWQQTQQATARAQTQFGNSVALEGLKQRNRLALAERKPTGEVDLSGMALPSRLTPQAQGPTLSGEPLGAAEAGTAALTSGTGAGMEAQPPLPLDQLDPLAVSALRPLAETQRLTGTKPTKSQVFGALSAERTRAQQDKRDAEKEQTKALSDESKAAKDAATQQRLILNSELATVKSDVSRHAAALEDHEARKKDLDKQLAELAKKELPVEEYKTAVKELQDEYFGRKAVLERRLQEAGQERARLIRELQGLGGKEVAAEKKLDVKSAAELLKEAGGDKEKARALARERGFTF